MYEGKKEFNWNESNGEFKAFIYLDRRRKENTKYIVTELEIMILNSNSHNL